MFWLSDFATRSVMKMGPLREPVQVHVQQEELTALHQAGFLGLLHLVTESGASCICRAVRVISTFPNSTHEDSGHGRDSSLE